MSQQDKTTLQSNINSQLADNTTGDISAADVRNNLINITDSLVFNNGDQSITGSLTVTGGIIGGPINSAVSTLYSTIGTTPTNFARLNSIFFGDRAGTDTSGSIGEASNSTFMGYRAGSGATYSGGSNFFGYETGYQAAFSNYSNFFGMQAGYQANTAAFSNFFGQYAGSYATNSSHSNFFGNQAGQNSTNAFFSNFFGRAAGFQATSASYSTIIGYLAGYAPSIGSTIGPNNIIIGTNITLEAGRRDSINIGGIIFGTGSNSISFPFGSPITGSSNGRIGINVIKPIYTLDVSGSGNYTNGLIVTGSVISTNGFTGSLQGTSATASYVMGANVNGTVTGATNAINSALVYTGKTDTNGEYKVLFTDNLNLDDNSEIYKENGSTFTYNPGLNRLSLSRILADNFTGSLQGTASYALTAQTLLGGVVSASYAATASVLLGSVTSASYAATASKVSITNTTADTNLSLTLTDGNSLLKDQYNSITYNTANNTLNIVAYTNFTGSVSSQDSITSTGGFTGSLQGTASLSLETIGAGDPSTYPAGGEIQFKGGTGPGSAEGKNTYSSAFLWSNFGPGLTIGDPNTSYGSGAYFLATGYDSIANGNYSVSHGSSSYANGEGSFTNGKTVTAAGTYSHAEGTNTQSPGNYSHAEGATTTSWGVGSHAEGNNTTANGDYSHTEGQNTTTNGYGSHAEGSSTTATGLNSHAEGANTLASASYSHAEGRFAVSRGQYSHAEGFYTTSSGLYSHAEGSGSIALGIGSHAEGQFTIASGSYQHVEGRFNTQGDTTSLLIVGNGTSNAARQDAFKVRQSGSIVLPTTQSIAPSWTGTDGEMVFATVTGNHFFYVWMAGAWRSGSLL
jgi:hypothetical protein